MAQDVTVSVKSELNKFFSELEKLNNHAKAVSKSMEEMGKNTSEALEKETKKGKKGLSELEKFGQGVANHLKDDFRALFSLNALQGALKFSSQLGASVLETISLSDAIKKVGRQFGLTRKEFGDFQSELTNGLGDIGLSSEAAAKALLGVSEAGVGVQRPAIPTYVKQAGMLASVTGQQGQENQVSKAIARAIQQKGGDINSPEEIKKMAEEARKVFNETGMNATEFLNKASDIFEHMPEDLQKSVGLKGIARLQAAQTVVGPQSMKMFSEFLSKSSIPRQRLEAQGFKGLFSEKGLDVEKFKKASQSILGRIGTDPRMAAQTLGLSEESAEAFVRLAKNADKLSVAQEKMEQDTEGLQEQFESSRTLMESFSATLNKVKSIFTGPLTAATNGLSNLFSKASKSVMDSAAIVMTGGVLSAILAGLGLKGIGAGLFGGGAAAAGGEAAAGAGAGLLGGGLAAAATTTAVVGGTGLAAYETGKYLIEKPVTKALDKYTTGKTSEGFEGNVLERLFYKLDKVLDIVGPGQLMTTGQHKVIIELNKRDLKEVKQGTRGGTAGPTK